MTATVTTPRRQLALLAVVQVLALSLWFSASAVVPALRADWGLGMQGGIWLTAIVQIGFAAGAVVSAVLNLADRIAPALLIGASALLGALATVAVALWSRDATSAVPLRFLVGFALAGVYPVGMKIVVSWFPRTRGVALGVMIGALTLGSALPQLLSAVGPPAAQTAIGFLLSVLTIQVLPLLAGTVGWRAAVPLLALGPLLGVVAMARLRPLLAPAPAAP